jgi:hypothetical protein
LGPEFLDNLELLHHRAGVLRGSGLLSYGKGFMPARRKNLVAGVLVGALLLVLVITALVFTPENPPVPPAGRTKPPQTESSDGG